MSGMGSTPWSLARKKEQLQNRTVMENRVVYLVRHGKIQQEDDQRRYIGQVDVPLAEEGIKQAQSLQRRFERADISAIYCSDLSRSIATARIIAGDRGIPIVIRKDLREVGMGEWEGCTFGEIAQRFPAEFKARGSDIVAYRVPGGESFADCSQRAIAALEDLMANSSGNLLIAGHAGLNRLLLCHMLGMPIANIFRIGQDYGCLNVIQCGYAGYQVKLMNGNGRSGRR
jgi:probable phosphoglycerate mutase